MFTGSCLCGDIRYRVTSELPDIQICHCQQCRKAQGTPFVTNIPVSTDTFKVTDGNNLLQDYESSPGKHRLFCKQCGSPILSRRDSEPHTVRVRAGTLDGPIPARPAFHIFTGDKAEWWELDDALPQHRSWPT